MTQQAESAGVLATFRDSPPAVKTVLGGVFVNRLGSFLNLFLVLYVVSRGYSTERAALALGVYGAGAIVGTLLGGALVNRLGARNATVISMTGAGVLTAALLYLPSYPPLLVAVALVGLAQQLYRPASATLLSELTAPGRQVMIFAMHRFGLNLGTTVAPQLGFLLYFLGHHGYTLVFWGEGVLALGYAALALATLPGRAAQAEAAAAHHPAGPGPAGDGGGGSRRSGYLALLSDRRYLLYLAAMLIHSAVYVQYTSTLPLDVHAAHLRIFWYTLVVSLNSAIVIAFELLVTRWTQHWPTRLTIGLGFGLLAVGVAGYGLPLVPAVILSATVVWSLGEIAGGPAMFAYPAVAAPARFKGQYIGSFQAMFGLGTAIGPVLGGWLFVALGHRVWPVLAMGSVLATVLGLIAIRTPSDTAGSPAEPAAESAGTA